MVETLPNKIYTVKKLRSIIVSIFCMIPYKFKAFQCQQGYIWQCQYMAYGTVTVYYEIYIVIEMNERSKFKVEAGYRPLSYFRISIMYKESHRQVIQRNSVSTRRNVTRHWIVWILSDSPVSPCLEIPDGPLGVGFGFSWNKALGESG